MGSTHASTRPKPLTNPPDMTTFDRLYLDTLGRIYREGETNVKDVNTKFLVFIQDLQDYFNVLCALAVTMYALRIVWAREKRFVLTNQRSLC